MNQKTEKDQLRLQVKSVQLALRHQFRAHHQETCMVVTNTITSSLTSPHQFPAVNIGGANAEFKYRVSATFLDRKRKPDADEHLTQPARELKQKQRKFELNVDRMS